MMCVNIFFKIVQVTLIICDAYELKMLSCATIDALNDLDSVRVIVPIGSKVPKNMVKSILKHFPNAQLKRTLGMMKCKV